MKITDDQTDSKSLAELCSLASQLLCSGDFSSLAEQFGYALAFDRDPASAIREELILSLAEIGASSLGEAPTSPPSVIYFQPNDTALFALVEQLIPTDSDGHILLEVIVSSRGADKHVELEQISAAA